MKISFLSAQLVLLLFLSLALFNACQKTQLPSPASNITSQFPKIEKVKLGEQNQEDANMNVQLTKIHQALLQHFTQQDVRDYLVTTARTNPENVVKLEDLMTQFPEIETSIRNAFPYSAAARTSGLEDLINYVKSQMVYESEEYEPVVHVPNIGSVTENIHYAVAIGAEIAGQDDDAIPGWIEPTNPDDGYTLVSITEENAIESNFPIFVICNGEVGTVSGGKNALNLLNVSHIQNGSSNSHKTSNINDITDLIFNNMEIKGCAYRYEQGTNKSEVKCAFRINNDSHYGGPNNYNTSAQFTSTEVCNQVQRSGGGIPQNNPGFSTDATVKDCFIDFFEFDWYSTKKQLPSFASTQNKGNMKYSNESYGSTGTTAIDFDLAFPVPGDNYLLDNYKMKVIVHDNSSH